MKKLLSKITRQNRVILLVALALIVFAMLARLLPHPPNFTPIAAVALFGALYLPKRSAILIPLVALFVSDIFIGFYGWPIMLAVYGSFALIGVIGFVVRRYKSLNSILAGTIGGTLLFFLVTNAAVWAFGTMYAPGVAGLIASYTAALPFLRASLAGNLFYVALLVGVMEFALYYSRFKQLKTAPQKVQI